MLALSKAPNGPERKGRVAAGWQLIRHAAVRLTYLTMFRARSELFGGPKADPLGSFQRYDSCAVPFDEVAFQRSNLCGG